MIAVTMTEMKVDSEPSFSKSKTGSSYCYFSVVVPKPLNGIWYKTMISCFGEVADRVKNMVESTPDKSFLGCYVNIVGELSPYMKNGAILNGFKAFSVSFIEGMKKETRKPAVEEKQAEEKKDNGFMNMADMLSSSHPFD